MDASVFLRQVKKIDKMIENKMIEKAQWQAIAMGVTSCSDGERVKSSGSQQKIANAVARYVDIEREIDQSIDKLRETKKDVTDVIEKLELTEYDVLHKIYVQHLTFVDVAVAYGKTYSWATTVHWRALKNVQKILDEREGENHG